MRKEWARVNKAMPCPVCQRHDWCMVAADGTAAICARLQSDKVVGQRGAGWLHRLADGWQQQIRQAYRPAPMERTAPARDWQRFAADCVAALPDLDPLPDSLGVAADALGRLRYGWSAEHGAYTFPMRADDGSIIGIRTRYRNGAKRSVTGSRNGLFYADSRWNGGAWICEGPTDCAALMTLGLAAIGRPSNTGGMDILLSMLRRLRIHRLVIIANRDPDGTTAATLTKHGADSLADAASDAGMKAKIVRPPNHKDVRDWLRNGATAAAVQYVADARDWE